MTFGELKSFVACENPKVIINPRFRQYEIIPKFDRFIYPNNDGTQKSIFISGISAYEKVFAILNYWVHTYTDNTPSDVCYFFNSSTGEIGCPFVAVRCNHCDLCYEAKRCDFSLRASFQLEQDKRQPFFITLTYNEGHNPKSVSKQHLDAFIKRFKTYYKRFYGLNCSDLKFFATSEYGKINFRPHYHIILFGFDLCETEEHRHEKLKKLCEYCWTAERRDVTFADFYEKYDHDKKFITDDASFFGGIDIKLVDKVGSMISYVTKYMTKDLAVDVPVGLSKNFRISPYKFGTFFFKQYIVPQVDKYKTTSVKYLSIFSGDIRECRLTRYYVNKMYPCVSQLIKGEIKRAYQYLCGYCKLKEIENPVQHPILSYVHFASKHFTCDDDDYFAECVDVVKNWLSKHIMNYGEKSLSWFVEQRAIVQGAQPMTPVDKVSKKQKILKTISKFKRTL